MPVDEVYELLFPARLLMDKDVQHLVDVLALHGETEMPEGWGVTVMQAVSADYFESDDDVLRPGPKYGRLLLVQFKGYSHLYERDVCEPIPHDRGMEEVYDDASLLEDHRDVVAVTAEALSGSDAAFVFDCVCESAKTRDELSDWVGSLPARLTGGDVDRAVSDLVDGGVIRRQGDGGYGVGENGVIAHVLLQEMVVQSVKN